MSYIKISRANFYHNLDFLSKKLGSKEKLAVVLKDNAYGHGLKLIANLSCEYGIKRAIVKTEDEALLIEELFEDIIILNPSFSIYKDNFSLVINSLSQLKKVTNQKIHLKFDTGMHRNGLKIEKIDTTDLNIVGIMTHFRSADELSCEQFCQQKQWQKVKEIYKDKDVLYHSGNSATVLRAENYEDDFARCGISIYGYEEMHGSFGEFDLKPVMSLYGEKISTRELKKGDRVGYGGVGVVLHDSMVSTYDIGYGDGFFRHDGKSELLLDGKKVVGRISMDSISLLGDDDKVCLIGDAKMIARKFNTISYDVLVKLNSSISREVV